MGKVRKLKVYGMGSYNGKDVATIVLKGKWLQKLGFEIGIPIQVECEEGRLVIVREEEQKEAKKVAKTKGEKPIRQNMFKVV